ncbi:MAG: hypothetical protein HKN85_08050 [Gammaproteobacteria bacterium]|nr:hypothetical protein [Gammaproteobacteria bacterium]
MADLNVPGQKCKYTLTQSGGEMGIARVNIRNKKFKVKLRGAQADKLYTVWIDFRMRADGSSLPVGFPATARVVAPAMASDAGVSNGIGPDENVLITDSDGDAQATFHLDYKVLQTDAMPVVGGLTMQGLNVVGGYWMRQYAVDQDSMASIQIVDKPYSPSLVRSTAAGVTIVRHDDTISHGLAPGTKNVDHFSAWNGDFPASCKQ